MSNYYLTGTTAHSFSRENINRCAENMRCEAYVIRNGDGGSIWAAYLSKKPVQHGQAAFKILPGETVLRP